MTTHEDLLTLAAELAELLAQRPEVEAYQTAEANMTRLPQVTSQLRRLRELQDQLGDFMARHVPETHFQHLRTEMEDILATLEAMPEVAAFIDAESRLNELIQAVTKRLAPPLQEDTTGE